MSRVNKHFKELEQNYLFADIARKVNEYVEQNPDKEIIRLGIGDVTRPIFPSVVEEIKKVADEISTKEGFVGYGPEQGHAFLREAIAKNDYEKRNINISANEIFISDGAKSDCANIVDLFSQDLKIAICNPVYPVYNDSNIMSGRKNNIIYMECTEDNNLLPQIPKEVADIIYLCFPNNPTGVVPTREYLKEWVDYANKHNSIIMYDSAYECFISDDTTPHSIFEIEGARTCAIEFRSFSKMAGFTGLRLSYTVVPESLYMDGECIKDMWNRRQTTKFNGASYIIQRAGLAVYREEGQREVKESIEYYKRNAKYMKDTLESVGLKVYGGEASPYVWAKTPNNMSSWEYFDFLLNECQIVATPGSGFGSCGEGYIRFSAFNTFENTKIAMDKVKANL